MLTAKNSINIPYTDIINKSSNLLPANKEQPILLYCNIGVTSSFSLLSLLAQGYKNIKNLKNGILEWVNSELPINEDSNWRLP